MSASGQLRIIGGKWKRRRLRFPAVPGLRPTPDAVRETVFNWLQGRMEGRNCLDLFAGSGALGFEAVSRGALSATLVEQNPKAVRALRENIELLDAQSEMAVVQSDALKFLQGSSEKFNLVFIDPPFSGFDITKLLGVLDKSSCIDRNTLLYIESPRSNSPLPIPDDWNIIRESRKGMVKSTLITI